MVFGLYNAGAPHAVSRAFDDAVSEGTLRLSPTNAVDAVRAYLTNDGDIARYFAYCRATLGRPYRAYYVRTLSEWQGAFALGETDPEAGPTRVPDAPLLPYRDFLVEYPPGFFLWAMPPALVVQSVDSYRLLFSSAMALLLTVALIVALRLAPLLAGAPPPSRRVIGMAALGVLLVGSVATHRYDAVISLSVIIAAWAALANRPLWLGLAVGIGAASKVVPLVAAPVWVMLLAHQRRWSHLAVAAAAAVASASIGLAPWLWGGALGDTAAYHGLRPLQLESTFAAALGLWHALGGPAVAVVQSYGSTNLAGAAAGFALRAAAPLTLAGLAFVYAWTWIRIQKAPSPDAARLAALQGAAGALVAFMVFGRVFSPQYLVWLVPLGALLAAARGGASSWLLLAALALTQVVYPATYPALQQLRPWACTLVLLRNALLVAWVWHFGTGDRRLRVPRSVTGPV